MLIPPFAKEPNHVFIDDTRKCLPILHYIPILHRQNIGKDIQKMDNKEQHLVFHFTSHLGRFIRVFDLLPSVLVLVRHTSV